MLLIEKQKRQVNRIKRVQVNYSEFEPLQCNIDRGLMKKLFMNLLVRWSWLNLGENV